MTNLESHLRLQKPGWSHGGKKTHEWVIKKILGKFDLIQKACLPINRDLSSKIVDRKIRLIWMS